MGDKSPKNNAKAKKQQAQQKKNASAAKEAPVVIPTAVIRGRAPAAASPAKK